MKKYLVFLLSVLMILGTVSFVVADDGGMDSVRSMKAGTKMMIGGDARVRGRWVKNPSFDSDAENDTRAWDQRVRLKFTGEAGNGFKATTRIKVANGTWNAGANTKPSTSITIDYAYITLPISSVVINAGSMNRYYGTGFMPGQYDDHYDTFEVVGKFESVTVTAFTNKIMEINTTGDDNLKDLDDYGVSLVADLGDMEAGAMVLFHNDGREEPTPNPALIGLNGTDIGVYAKGDVSGIGVGAELAFLTGDINKDAADNTPLGFMAYAKTTVGAIGVRVDGGYATNSFTSDNNYKPTLLFGNDQHTAVLGQFGAAADAKAWIIAGTANTDVMEDVNVLGRVGYGSVEEAGGGDKASLLELDGAVVVQLAKNARYIFEAAYGNPGGDLTPDDADSIIVIANRAEIYF
jgi:hypothetical protein